MNHRNKGFTLIELVTVMVIVAIVTFIGVPSYKSHIAKARRKEGLNLLGDYFEAAHMVYAQFKRFPGNFVATGFQPEGTLNYRVRAENNGVPLNGIIYDDPNCIETGALCNCDSSAQPCPDFKIWKEMPLGSTGAIGVSAAVAGECGALGLQEVTDTTFKVGVGGWINTSASQADRIFINERKVTEVCEDGVN